MTQFVCRQVRQNNQGFPRAALVLRDREAQVNSDVRGSVPKQLKVSDMVRSRAWCMYRHSGISRRNPMVLTMEVMDEENIIQATSSKNRY